MIESLPDLKIGFTGTRIGMTHCQQNKIFEYLWKIKSQILEFHHGDCLGADKEIHDWVYRYLQICKIIVHPPDKNYYRAFCKGDEIRKPLPFLVRNVAIIRETSFIIGAPKEMNPTVRGGTWFTLRKTKEAHKPFYIVYKDGSTNMQRNSA